MASRCDLPRIVVPLHLRPGLSGVLTEPAPELIQGCCSYGAHASDKKDMKKIERLAEELGDDEWQFRKRGLQRGVWKSVGKDDWRTAPRRRRVRLPESSRVRDRARVARCTSTPSGTVSTSARPSRRCAGSSRCARSTAKRKTSR